MFDATAELKRVQSERAERLALDILQVMSTDYGRRFVRWLVYDLGNLQGVSFTNKSTTGNAPLAVKDGGSSAMHTTFLEGRRDMAVDIHNAALDAAPEHVCEMTIEHIQETVMIRARLTPRVEDSQQQETDQ